MVQKSLDETRSLYRANPKGKAKVDKATDLYWKLHDIPHAVIPSSLKAFYEAAVEETPDKSRKGPRSIDYNDRLPYPPQANYRFGSQQGRVASQARENCTVDIDDIRTKINSGQNLSYQTESVAALADDESNGSSQSVSKMVDWTLALDPDDEDEHNSNRAFNTMNSDEWSLNQSSSYIRKSPLFTNIELKMPYAGGDPGVQLALWESGALHKRRWHRWDTSLPMPDVCIEGHVWHWYLFIALGKGLGPPRPLWGSGKLSSVSIFWSSGEQQRSSSGFRIALWRGLAVALLWLKGDRWKIFREGWRAV
ncbi:MAG: hypothetical protein Q9220_006154 [cf. Caloplaca sp. 1 TL-2023]